MLATWISLFLRLFSKSSKEWMPLVSISVTAAIIWLLNYYQFIINYSYVYILCIYIFNFKFNVLNVSRSYRIGNFANFPVSVCIVSVSCHVSGLHRLKVLRDISTMRCCILGYSLDVLRISSSVSHFNIL